MNRKSLYNRNLFNSKKLKIDLLSGITYVDIEEQVYDNEQEILLLSGVSGSSVDTRLTALELFDTNVDNYLSINGVSGVISNDLSIGGTLGIGTDSPDELVTIYGSSNPKLHIVNTAEDDAGIKLSDSAAISTQNFEMLFNSSSQNLRFKSDSADNIILMEPGGAIGIGTDNALAKFHVEGLESGLGFRLVGNQEIYADGVQLTFHETDNGDKAWHIGLGSGNLSIVETGVAGVMTFEAGGNIGIGTSNPSEKLHVNGDIRTNTHTSLNTEIANLITEDIAIGVTLISYNSRLDSLENYEISSGVTLVSYNSRLDSLETYEISSGITLSTHNDRLDSLETYEISSGITLSTHNDRLDSLETYEISSGITLSTHNDRLDLLETYEISSGVTLVSYDARLDSLEAYEIASGITHTLLDNSVISVENSIISHDNRIDEFEAIFENDKLKLGSSFGTAGSPSYAFNPDTNTGIFQSVVDNLQFSTGGVERLRIDDTGVLLNHNIGTEALPSYTFFDDPDTGIFSPSTNVIAMTTGGTERFRCNSNGIFSSGSFFFLGDTDTYISNPVANEIAILTGGSERLRIDSAGNVGIGTNNPISQFQIGNATSGTQSAVATFSESNTGSESNCLTLLNSAVSTVGNSASINWNLGSVLDSSAAIKSEIAAVAGSLTDMRFYTYNAGLNEKMVIKSNGDVGIGTVSPNAKLHINGVPNDVELSMTGRMEIYAPGTHIKLFESDNSNKAFHIAVGGGNLSIVETGIAGHLTLRAGGQMAMTSDGSATAPTFTWTSDLNTGIYRKTTDSMSFTTAGVERVNIDASGDLTVGSTTTVQQMHVYSQSVPALETDGIKCNFQILNAIGTVSAPAYSFQGDTDSGMYYSTVANEVRISESGTFVMSFEDVGGNAYALAQYDLGYVNSLINASDSRIKKNIVPKKTNECYDIIKNIQLKTYDKIHHDTKSVKRNEIGVLAQDMLKLDPDMVRKTKKKFMIEGIEHEGLLNVDVDRLIKTMLGTIQELIKNQEILIDLLPKTRREKYDKLT